MAKHDPDALRRRMMREPAGAPAAPKALVDRFLETLPLLVRLVDAREALGCACDGVRADRCAGDGACACYGAMDPQ